MVEFDAPGPFVVQSQDAAHPFYFAQYMTGGQPLRRRRRSRVRQRHRPAQYLPRYTFFTDPTYPETNLVVVRALDAATGQFPDVTLDCAGRSPDGSPSGSSGIYEFTRIDLSTGDFEGQNGCNNGVHTITGAFPDRSRRRRATLDAALRRHRLGLGQPDSRTLEPTTAGTRTEPNFTLWVSYAYPAGANITRLNNVVVSAH